MPKLAPKSEIPPPQNYPGIALNSLKHGPFVTGFPPLLDSRSPALHHSIFPFQFNCQRTPTCSLSRRWARKSQTRPVRAASGSQIQNAWTVLLCAFSRTAPSCLAVALAKAGCPPSPETIAHRSRLSNEPSKFPREASWSATLQPTLKSFLPLLGERAGVRAGLPQNLLVADAGGVGVGAGAVPLKQRRQYALIHP